MDRGINDVLSFEDFCLLCGFKAGNHDDYLRISDILEDNGFKCANEIVFMQMQYHFAKEKKFNEKLKLEFLKLHYDYLHRLF